MKRSVTSCAVVSMLMTGLLHVALPVAHAQTGSTPAEWRFYGGDPGHTKYSPLDQITKDNVGQLKIAWTWTSVDETLRVENPVIGNGRRFRTYAHEVTPQHWLTGELWFRIPREVLAEFGYTIVSD